jgi:hypothetical protein
MQLTYNRTLRDIETRASRTGEQLYGRLRLRAPRSEANMLAIANEREALRDGTHNAVTPSSRINDSLSVSSPAIRRLRFDTNDSS